MSRALRNRASRSGIDHARVYPKKIGHADYRLWAEQYGWEPDPERKQAEIRHNDRKKSERRLHRKHSGLVKLKNTKLYPVAANKASRLCSSAKRRSEFLRIPFDLTGEWVLEKLLAGKCEATGVAFEIYESETDSAWRRGMFAPSLDQINPGRGYTKDNVQVVCWCYNAAKSTGTDADVLKMAEALVAKSKLGKYEG